MHSIIDKYQDALNSGSIDQDSAQALVIESLDRLYQQLISQKKSLFDRLKKKRIEGLYIYGGVGRGKTFLMDMFFSTLPDSVPKKRIHFHEFMRDAHEFLHAKRQHSDGKSSDHLIPALADHIAAQCKVLCFDEFHVVDIADAMILGRLLEALFERHIIIICTSNWKPDELYKDGLQRARFLPAIESIKQHMASIYLDSPHDYRTGRLSDKDLYHHPHNQDTENKLDFLFAQLSDGHAGKPETLLHKSRSLEVPTAANGVARFQFQDLCEKPLGAHDYIMLANKYHSIVLENIPRLTYDRRNETKRLITLIDVLYENHIMLIISAADPPHKLYAGHDHAFEFDRTISRLMEMQSHEYREQHKLKIKAHQNKEGNAL